MGHHFITGVAIGILILLLKVLSIVKYTCKAQSGCYLCGRTDCPFRVQCTVQGMDNSQCALRVEATLNAIDGVEAFADGKTQQLILHLRKPMGAKAICDNIQRVGPYKVVGIQRLLS